ncbi:MAG TPA: mannose-1-phosphate guanylyltransferase/mannose-6-phosphate isomerase [Rhabdaerophilum sp.]|nr:mannose-1-phosphate guanylyltransferase/mannose-6-phosphate isomerase [Rhabdaerophilum sp.]
MSNSLPPIRPVIMCGGSGTRLWPASREAFPKQFAPIIGDKSTFQETLLRFKDAPAFGKPLVVTNKTHRFMVERQLVEIDMTADILLEPVARDSGPAILASALHVAQQTPGALALVLAADHMVLKPEAFRRSILDGAPAAVDGAIVTFGILPTGPATGYGYIEPGDALDGKAHRVARFVEKPDLETALRYVANGLLWNSGNFLFRPETVISEYERFDPQGAADVRAAIANANQDLGVPVLDEAAFTAARKISFDFAVMEKTGHAAVIAADFGWSDIGGWDALWDIGQRDLAGNVTHGNVELFATGSSYVSSESQLVVTLGVENLVVVSTRDAVLVADKARTGEVKGVVEALRAKGHEQATNHARIYRPWGWYQTLELQENFQVKRIVVYPGGRLSLQKHAFRAEHWVVVRGIARVTIDTSVRDLEANQSTYIPLGAVHRLENPTQANVEIIEVQTGTYLGEDDIIRLEDDYARK